MAPVRTRAEADGEHQLEASDLTVELCEGYRQTLWIPPEPPESL
ncbi:conserved hypothetical protein [Mycobacterium marinum M]|uniref:Uncharacterized protein n=1 Tax=Mycobacterium marinum (strain ATCC BAA-535 / M) TaxID=216594 RepID=B2HIG4_MYCMM|nr:conserved hypothetical protein [Mycobacterium marinum M]